jgi:hypothetical protein
VRGRSGRETTERQKSVKDPSRVRLTRRLGWSESGRVEVDFPRDFVSSRSFSPLASLVKPLKDENDEIVSNFFLSLRSPPHRQLSISAVLCAARQRGSRRGHERLMSCSMSSVSCQDSIDSNRTARRLSAGTFCSPSDSDALSTFSGNRARRTRLWIEQSCS